jgi:Tfp pilus assembly protein PilF
LKRALEEEPNSVDAMRGLTDIYSKRGSPYGATEEHRQKEIERARELYYKNEDYGIG